jgi:allantoin racemase
LTAQEVREHEEEWSQFAGPETIIEEVRVRKGAATLESHYDEEAAAPFILEEVAKAANDGVAGIIIHCMSDPALFAARELVGIPVLGEGLACYVTAIALGDRFSVISPIYDGVRRRAKLRLYGLDTHLASIRSLGIPVADLRHDLDRLRTAFRDQAKSAIMEDGAEVIVPGCGEIYGIAEEISEELGVPVVDPRAAVVGFMEMLIRASLTHSKQAYPRPPEKRRELF